MQGDTVQKVGVNNTFRVMVAESFSLDALGQMDLGLYQDLAAVGVMLDRDMLYAHPTAVEHLRNQFKSFLESLDTTLATMEVE